MLKVVGAGLGRTGTMSLKLALEHLLGGPCYHMIEVFSHPEHIPLWSSAARGESIDWPSIFDGYVATVDWPSCSFWQELSNIYPDALVILSSRDANSWWKSASSTIFPTLRKMEDPQPSMMHELLQRTFTSQIEDRSACIEAFERHNALVRNSGLGDRLLEWQAGDGWEPLCKALGVQIPTIPFPHANSTEEFVQRLKARED
jgi:hypothetical protein